LTLEFHNTTRFTSIRVRPGDRIGQVVFFRCAPVPEEYAYAKRGRYNRDVTAQPIKP
jgi:deoxycytidine triphosphate deaminase